MNHIENYFDYAATTPVDPEVLKSMEPYFFENFGNPSSAHSWGQEAFAAVENSRSVLAELFHADSAGVIFTGSSTEANNMILNHAVLKWYTKNHTPAHILISSMEHSAVRAPSQALQEMGFCEAEQISTDSYGRIDPDEVKRRIRSNTVLVSIIYGNNEIGTINPISEIGLICRNEGIPFHSDATQYAAHARIDMEAMNLDYMTIAGHKCYGPKGIGALIKRDAEPLIPLVYGGRQEIGQRAGTSNVPYIMGIRKAYEIRLQKINEFAEKEKLFRDEIIKSVLEQIPDAVLTGHPQERLANHASFAFKNVDATALQALLDRRGFAVSIGSACRSTAVKGQQILRNLQLSEDFINGGLRITVGRYNTEKSVRELVNAIKETVLFLRNN